MLKEVLLGPMCQVLQVAFGNLRLSYKLSFWVPKEMFREQNGELAD